MIERRQIDSCVIEGGTPGNDSWLLLDERDSRFLLDEGELSIRLLLNEGWIGGAEMLGAWVLWMRRVYLMVRMDLMLGELKVVKLCANMIRGV